VRDLLRRTLRPRRAARPAARPAAGAPHDPSRRLKLMFLHVPKAGGRSVGEAIAAAFGARLYRDYDDHPADPAAPANFDPDGYLEAAHGSGYPWLAGKDAVMGHFWARKYEPVAFEVRATVLREPIARALSHYAFWMAREAAPNVLREYLVERRLDFMAFARIPTINRFYVDHLFRGADMASFDLIGDQGRLGRDWAGVLARMGLAAPETRLNVTQAYDAGYPDAAREVLEDPARMARLRDLFAADIAFYERWAER
jgi:hypothetical protein